jgi:hypothetical protein
MRALANSDFDPSLPLQTKKGAAQALRCGHNTVDALIRRRVLKVVYIDRIAKITTSSIQALVQPADQAA